MWQTPQRSRYSCASTITPPRPICTSLRYEAFHSHCPWRMSYITTPRDPSTTPGSSKSTSYYSKKNRKKKFKVGPGLAQLVERLTHRYSESTSLNPGNLTSATVCGERTGCAPAAKRLASVAPEVDLRKNVHYIRLRKKSE